jgi:rhodanese-related sulfurtransferase
MKRIPIIPVLLFFVLSASYSQAVARLPPKIGFAELSSLLASPQSSLLLLDVRTADEFAAGHIKGAVLAPYDELAATFAEKDRDRPIVVYCRSGRRSAIAKATLESMGYRNVSDFGGINNWKGPLVPKANKP